MKRPALWMLFYMIGGILIERMVSFSMWLMLLTAIFIISTVFLCKLWRSKAPIVFLCCFILGFILMHRVVTPTELITQKESEEKKEVSIEGAILKTELTKNEKQRITVRVSHGSLPTAKVLVYFDGNTELSIGDKIACKGSIQPFQARTTPGVFDEFSYWRAKGYDYKFFADAITVQEKSKGSLRESFFAWKDKLEVVYDAIFPTKEAGIIKAMLMGDKEDVSEQTRYIYKQAGIAHILAISGLHISIISMSIYYLLTNLLKQSRRKSSAIAMAILPLFIVFTGFSPSSVRAAIMVMVGLMGNLFYRSGDSINNVAIAAIILLCIQPLYLWDIGFQLSFVTVMGIIIGMGWLEQWNKIPRYVANSLGVSFFALVSSFPVTAYHFHSFSMIGMVTNLIVVPLMEVLLVMGILTGVVGLFSISAASFLGGIVYYILQLYEVVCITAAKMPWASVAIGKFSVFSAILCYVIFFWIYCMPQKANWEKYIFGGLLLLLFIFFTGNRMFFHHNTIAFLDVGQGDSTVITSYDGQAFVIDGGGQYQKPFGSNTGNKIVTPYLEYQGVKEIDGLFLTHMDKDHGYGVLELMAYMPVKKVFISDYSFEKSDFYYSFLNIANERKIPVFLLKAGDKVRLTENMEMSCLYPMKEAPMGDDDNHGSMVLRLDMEELSVLFMGDAGYEDEEVMLENKALLDCTILKAGHHGSKYSTSTEFLKEASPKIAIISCGKNNVYGHPHEETLKRLEDAKVDYIQTKESGTISITTNGEKYWVKTMIGRP